MITLQQMLINFSSIYPNLWHMITAIAYVMGMSMVMRAIYKLKIYGEMRTMMSHNTNISEPLMILLAGSVLLYLPTGFSAVMESTFGYSSAEAVLGYTNVNFQWSVGAMRAVLGFIQLIGLIAFIRGWIIVSKGEQQQARGSSMAKAIAHIFGGIMAVNVVGTKNMIWATFGFT